VAHPRDQHRRRGPHLHRGGALRRRDRPAAEPAGIPEVAPECLQLEADDFIPSGGSFEFVEGEEEDAASVAQGSDHVEKERYQCCIHPWMKTLFLVRE
jgi:hypothetical protein